MQPLVDDDYWNKADKTVDAGIVMFYYNVTLAAEKGGSPGLSAV